MEENKTLEEFLEEAPPVDQQARVSRRKFLTGAVAGGAAGCGCRNQRCRLESQ
jgi:hypothetical protein